ncbi:MAG TPA: helix-turn-helix transcriptional regulator [Amycolatopsis sp.]|jgi:DNA-binding CsgD family transcriptional regulator|nr:helix-turn-helix transcriptional regulator [Amycolatopsis sp.]
MPTPPNLSSREREVLRHFGRGLTYLQIARRMGIACSTVDTYLRRVRVKSGAASGAELVRLAVILEQDTLE